MIKRRIISREEYKKGCKHVLLGVLSLVLLFGGILLVLFREALNISELGGALVCFTGIIPIFFLDWKHINDYNLYLEQRRKRKSKEEPVTDEEAKDYYASVEAGIEKEKNL